MSIHDDGIHDSPGGYEDLQEQLYLEEFPLAINARLGRWEPVRSTFHNSRNYLKCAKCQKVEVGTFGIGLCAKCHEERVQRAEPKGEE